MADNAALQDLVERSRIAEVINRLFVSTDRRDWVSVRACFASEVLFDMSSLGAGAPVRTSPGAIAAGWEAGLKPIEHVHHQSGNLSIHVDGPEATASCYAVAYHHRRTQSGRNVRVFVGSYEFRLVLEGEWRITLIRFNLKFVDGNAALEQEPPA